MVKKIINAIGLNRSITRIAVEIIEENNSYKNNLIFVGTENAGNEIAKRLANAIEDLEDISIPVITLEQLTKEKGEVSDKIVVLVTKVISKGWLIEEAINKILSLGKPRSIQLAVLIDRGHRELPIGANYIGKNVPTAKSEFVEVRLNEIDGEDAVYLQ
ncbi:bifunctional pyr operon transcriptional regulator/uracil phosphoribosyltransferase [Xylocopilactobacillus apicola]|uniref:Bifunctional protein PyrR n=1 Tax=Xylocopilactobacillus apicola TaxID=2932184 RepID=A0AAU9CX80_9LACO|nr:bifunctional pyr operon transcriptional regulator/uracil phosphoribosyltransferase [Xylocopilactobacillus apicola]BDR58604.1 bifunctional protein PyrR [Xylocopilactobacillus apicola]